MEIEEKEIPTIRILDDMLHISISALDLMRVVNGNPDNGFHVTDEFKFLKMFANELGRYQSSNAQETGLTELQVLFDNVSREVAINDSDEEATKSLDDEY